MSQDKYLYRGCSVGFYKKTKGLLTPKAKNNEPFASFMCDGQEYAQDGRGFVDGFSAVNEIIRHEYKQKAIPTSGISTTPHIERAKFYATKGGEFDSGYIYKIDRSLLKEYCITEWVVADCIPHPSVPGDDEVILVAHDFDKLPEEIIVSVDFFEII